MKLTVLTDNNTYIDQYYLGEPAACYYLQDEGSTLLFDTGYSDVYVRNARALGLDLGAVDTVVLSHGHDDHTGGLAHFPVGPRRPRLVCHPGALEEKRADGLSICSPLGREALAQRFDLCLTRDPVPVSPHITFLGQIPRITDFEGRNPVGQRRVDGQWQDDFLLDDTALVYQAPQGIYLITGCSHAGICNIIEQAKRVTGDRRVLGILGGFHLLHVPSEQVDRTVEYLAREQIPELYPCHCTCFAARAAIHQAVPVKEVGVGLTIEW